VEQKGSIMMYHCSMMEDKGSMMECSQGSKEIVELGNKICPISGEKVGQMGEVVKVEYNGKIYNLCCPMCKKDFLKDPEKYSKIAEEEVKAEKGQMSDEEEMGHDHSEHEHQHQE
ncbi:MAG: TRASH domain-containing protein, partial [Candidatus Omnitrophica bacterium]|nr:TRASH domain-containing protein [Candidatus Omnitrophota bacterium]